MGEDYTTKMNCIKTFLLAVCTTVTTKHYTEERNIDDILDTQKMSVRVDEGDLSTDGLNTWVRHKIMISEVNEAGLTATKNNIKIGINKFNKRTAITDFTYASAPKMHHMKYAYSSKPWENATSKRWGCNIFLDIEWSTS